MTICLNIVYHILYQKPLLHSFERIFPNEDVATHYFIQNFTARSSYFLFVEKYCAKFHFNQSQKGLLNQTSPFLLQILDNLLNILSAAPGTDKNCIINVFCNKNPNSNSGNKLFFAYTIALLVLTSP